MNDFSLVLASGSRYRRELLERLGLPFEAWAPDVDEAPRPSEPPLETARRLSRTKAEAAGKRFGNAWVIGSDQVADLEGRAIGKPGSRDKARAQLQSMRGRTVHFHTGVCLLNAAQGRMAERLVTTTVVFRALTDAEIERYLDREPAFDCAGGIKSEGLGISLHEALASDDPTALVGLPLIALSAMLRAEGFEIP